MKLVLDSGQEIILRADIPEDAVITNAVVAFESVSLKDRDDDGIGYADMDSTTMATRLGLAAYLYRCCQVQPLDD